ncbi:MAG: hypothetical protein ABI397_03525 [Candidatus Saccharimonas sp.]
MDKKLAESTTYDVEDIKSPEEIERLHDESIKQFPTLNLSEGEYVVRVVRRHPIGMFWPAVMTTLLLTIVLSLVLNFDLIRDKLHIFSDVSLGSATGIGLLITALILAGGYAAIWVFINNQFILTNESVIQEIQLSLFSKREQTISLGSVKDVSFQQRGPGQTMLNFGSIRLSTEGEGTSYDFTYVANPKEQLTTLNNMIEVFKANHPNSFRG